MNMEWLRPSAFFGSLVYAVVGVVVFWLSFLLLDKLTPAYRLWEEIVEKHNIALAILVGSMAIGLSMIIAAAIHG